MTDKVILDLGCGMNKRPGMIGLDSRYWPGVDHVIDLTRDKWPIADDSVDGIFSSHMLEHIDHGQPLHFFLREVGRVCKDQASIEIWTPHARGRGAFLPGHVAWLDEYIWILLCSKSPNPWHESMKGAWLLNEIRFQVCDSAVRELAQLGTPLRHAIKHLSNVIEQFGMFATFSRTPPESLPALKMTVSTGDRVAVYKELPIWGT